VRALVPKGRKKSERAILLGSPRYRRGMLDRAREFFRSARVPGDQAAELTEDDRALIGQRLAAIETRVGKDRRQAAEDSPSE